MNVIGTRPNGWWRNRDAAVRRLVERLQTLAAADGEEITAVFDGRPIPGLAEGEHAGVHVLYAGRSGPDAADDRIAELVSAEADPASLTVVTSDRALRARVEDAGAGVTGASMLLRRLDEVAGA